MAGRHVTVTEPTPASVPPQPTVIADAEICQSANDEPVRVSLASDRRLNDPPRDNL
jgi:hypothetical protein